MSPNLFWTIQVILSFLDAYLASLYIRTLCQKAKEIPGFIRFSGYILLGLIFLLNNLITRLPFPFGPSICLILSFFFLLIITFQYQCHIYFRVFVSLSLLLLGALTECLAFFIVRIFFPDSLLHNFCTYTLALFLSRLFLYSLVLFLYSILRTSELILSKKQLLYVLISAIGSCLLFLKIGVLSTESAQQATHYDFICYVVILYFNLLLFNLIKSFSDSRKNILDSISLREQLKLQETLYLSSIASFKQVRSLVHDTHSHNLYLQECLKTGKYQKAEDYLAEIMNQSASIIPVSTGNLSIDALINNCSSICIDKGILFHTILNVDNEQIPLSDYEMNIVLGNLLDNAIQHASLVPPAEEPFIDVVIENTPSAFVLYCRNLYQNFSSPHNKDTQLKGCGLLNIENTIKPYSGLLTTIASDTVFEITVSIPYRCLHSKKDTL